MKQTAEQKKDLAAAKEAAPDAETLRDIAARVPPLQRDDEHSFVAAEDTDLPDPDAELGKEKTLTITRPDRAESEYERSTAFSETELERLSDEQIEGAGVLKKATPRIDPARLAPSSEQPRAPNARAPAAGAGSWPVNESQMPAVMPTDGPVEKGDEQHDADNGFAKRAGLSTNKDGSLSRKGLRIEKREVAAAAALYLRLRQQFPALTTEQLADEFELQWLSGRVGAPQSHRAGAESSPHGLAAAGDERVTGVVEQGKLRRDAPEASPEGGSPPTPTPEAGLPSENEPSSTAPDDAKEPSGDVAKADAEAVAQTEKNEEK